MRQLHALDAKKMFGLLWVWSNATGIPKHIGYMNYTQVASLLGSKNRLSRLYFILSRFNIFSSVSHYNYNLVCCFVVKSPFFLGLAGRYGHVCLCERLLLGQREGCLAAAWGWHLCHRGGLRWRIHTQSNLWGAPGVEQGLYVSHDLGISFTSLEKVSVGDHIPKIWVMFK